MNYQNLSDKTPNKHTEQAMKRIYESLLSEGCELISTYNGHSKPIQCRYNNINGKFSYSHIEFATYNANHT